MSTIKADAVTAVSTNADLSLDGLGTGGVSIASTLKMTKGGDIASASPLVIDTDGSYYDVTGTANFSAMTVEAGNFFMLQFDGALTITHGSGIELPGAANLTTATGDRLICYATAANTVEVMSVETEASASGGGGLKSAQVFTSSGTWTRPSGIIFIKVTTCGAGGGGGGMPGSTAGQATAGGGGATAIEYIDVSSISSVTVTIGAGGAGGVGANAGTGGGTSSFGSHNSCTGGTGGLVGTASNADGVNGGAATGGTINLAGGGSGEHSTSSAQSYSDPGESMFGVPPKRVTSTATGAAGLGYGAGGLGSHTDGANTGGAGSAGIIIVEEYK